MKKTILFLSVLCLATFASAQDVEIPIFDDITSNTPKIGRTADPLDSLILTPKPLPEVDVMLDNSQRAEQPKVPEKPKVVEAEKPSAPMAPSAPISLRKDNAVIKITRTEKKEEPAPKPVLEPMPEIAKPVIPVPLPEAATTQTPQGLENLFGKVHDVKGFEVAGLALGMTPDEVSDVMAEQGYKRTAIKYSIPMFRTSFYEQACRDKKIYPTKDRRKCIEGLAADDEVKYISSMSFANKKTNEYIMVSFSSNATDNEVFKVNYESRGDNSLSMTQKNLAKQVRRKDQFWKMMFDTYGLPDDSDLVVWGDQQKASMQATMTGSAYDAYIVLEDKEIQDSDYFSAEDESKELNYRNPFTFAGEE